MQQALAATEVANWLAVVRLLHCTGENDSSSQHFAGQRERTGPHSQVQEAASASLRWCAKTLSRLPSGQVFGLQTTHQIVLETRQAAVFCAYAAGLQLAYLHDALPGQTKTVHGWKLLGFG